MSEPRNSTRRMERRRRLYATLHCVAAIGFTVLTIVGLIHLPVGWKVFLGVTCLVLDWDGLRRARKLWRRAGHAAQGALAEEKFALLLEPLKGQGWQIQADIQIKYWGNVDFHLIAPTGKHFIVDVKSEGGTIFFDEQKQDLKKRYGHEILELAGNHGALRAARGQGAQMSKLAKAGFVTPILCFTRANIHNTIFNQYIALDGINARKRGQVYVTNSASVVSKLLDLSVESTLARTNAKL